MQKKRSLEVTGLITIERTVLQTSVISQDVMQKNQKYGLIRSTGSMTMYLRINITTHARDVKEDQITKTSM